MSEMEEKPTNYTLPIIIAISLTIGLIVGSFFHVTTTLSSNETEVEKLKDILNILDQRYVDPIDKDKIFETTIQGMLHHLDPHSNYIAAKEMQSVNESIDGKFGGVGVRFQIIRDTVCITSVLPNAPAEYVGIKAGDKIIKISGKPFTGKKINNDKVLANLKGDVGTEVNVTVLRKRKALDFSIQRGEIPIKTVLSAYMIDQETGYILIDQFSIPTAEEFHKQALKLKAKGMKKIILDLRNNGGGVLTAATDIADEFLKEGLVMLKTKGRIDGKKVYYSKTGGILENMKAVVLINAQSASASEILAGALQDNDRAIIVGRRSFGKGLVQEDRALRDGSNLRITIARYYTPSGRCIQKPYNGDYDAYMRDEERYANGEMYHVDTTLFADSLKFKTLGGRTVYGGGGITPDVFVAYDTTDRSDYLTELLWSGSFGSFAFDYIQNKRGQWKSPSDFVKQFQVSTLLLNQFTSYAAKNYKVKFNPSAFSRSQKLIAENIKAEIARQLWTEEGLYMVLNTQDQEVKAAIEQLKKVKP